MRDEQNNLCEVSGEAIDFPIKNVEKLSCHKSRPRQALCSFLPGTPLRCPEGSSGLVATSLKVPR